MVYHRDGLACPSGLKPVGEMGGHGGQVFRPASGPGSLDEIKGQGSAEYERRKRDRERAAQVQRDRAIKSAQQLWRRVANTANSTNHEQARAYVAARGIRLEALPGGGLPATIRFAERMDRWSRNAEGNGFEDRPAPALVCVACDTARRIVAVQRIYLERDGTPKKLSVGDGDDAKKALGSGSGGGGAAVRLSPVPASGTLILTEGVETGLAVLAAVWNDVKPESSAGVWACIATSWMMNVEIPAEMLSERRVRRVIIAADHDQHKHADGTRPGEHAARVTAMRLRAKHPGLEVGIALPDRMLVPEMSNEAGDPAAGKSVDWLDVYVTLGAGAVRDRILAAACEASPQAPKGDNGGRGGIGDARGTTNDDGGPPFIAETRRGRAKDLLMSRFVLPAGERGDSCFTVAYHGGRFHEFVDGHYVEVEQRELEAEATHALDDFFDVKRNKVVPFDPTPAEVNAALTAAIPFVSVPSQIVPAWMPPMFDRVGEPTWLTSLQRRAHREPPPVRAESCVVAENGVLDVDALVDGRVRMLPLSPRLFTLSRIPHSIDTALLEAALKDDGEEGIGYAAAEMCPTWMKFVTDASGGDPDWIAALDEYFGYCYTSDYSQQRFLMVDGLTGTGKGVIADALMWAVGEENTGTTTFNRLGGRFDLAPLVGKLSYQMREFRLGSHSDTAGGQDVLLMLTSHDPLTIERKGVDAEPTVRLTGKLMVTLNGNFGLRDPAAALVRRMLVLTMEPFKGAPDRQLGAKIRAESLGIFYRGLQGLLRLRRQKRFTETRAGLELRDSIQSRMAPVADFVREHCATGPEYSVACEVLRRAFRQTMEDRGLTGMAQISDGEFGEQLRSALGAVHRKARGPRGQKRTYFYDGLRLLTERDYRPTEDGQCTKLAIDTNIKVQSETPDLYRRGDGASMYG